MRRQLLGAVLLGALVLAPAQPVLAHGGNGGRVDDDRVVVANGNGTKVSNAGADANGGSTPRFAVFVNEAGRAKQVPVALAARNGSAAWIKSGLATGQQVIVYPPATVRDGIRVAARKV